LSQKSKVGAILIQDTVIPPRSEAILTAAVESNGEIRTQGILDPSIEFEQRHSTKLAASLVDLSRPTIPVRIINPTMEELRIPARSVMGVIETVDQVVPLFNQEIEEEEILVRRVGQTDSTRPEELGDITIPEHFKDLYKSSIEHVTYQEEKQVGELLLDYENAFVKSKYDLGRTNICEHTINTGDAIPFRQRPRRTPHAFAEEEGKEIKRMLDMGVIKESTSPWASPVVLVRRTDGGVRFCVDYRKLNDISLVPNWPLPLIDDCLNTLKSASYLSTMDLASGYWQIPVQKEDQPKTSFAFWSKS
jgi:hypothetical protein